MPTPKLRLLEVMMRIDESGGDNFIGTIDDFDIVRNRYESIDSDYLVALNDNVCISGLDVIVLVDNEGDATLRSLEERIMTADILQKFRLERAVLRIAANRPGSQITPL